MNTRIKTIDGFRAIAILGVLWAHVWFFLDNPAFLVNGKDISGVFSFWGTGVDLFFVISGFCMYLMQFTKTEKLSLVTYREFLWKRFLRIAPAFYTAVIVYCLIAIYRDNENFNYLYAISNIFFVNILTNVIGSGSHFWSLNTEWHFYFVLPLLMIFFKNNNQTKHYLFVILLMIVSRAIIWYSHHDPNNFIRCSIANTIIEFFFGMIVCKLYVENKIPKYCNTFLFFILGFAVAFAGRLLMTAVLKLREDLIGNISRTLDLPLLSLGFSMMVISCLNSTKNYSKFIMNNFFLFIGKYSYSLYLWHWIVTALIAAEVKKLYPNPNFLLVNVTFIVTLLILIPISIVSYQLLEVFYFKYFSNFKKDKSSN